jgi:5-methylcytosine-specific restriction endonuclease McrA
MILSKTVLVKLCGNNIKYYESLGYKIPKQLCNKYRENKIRVKTGTTLKVAINDLPTGSHYKILVRCDNTKCCHGINNKPFERMISYLQLKTTQGKYFCRKCANNTLDHINKQKIIQTGKIHSKETKEKISSSLRGENNPNFNPKLSKKDRAIKRNIFGYDKWRKNILIRNNYTCQKCGSKEHLQVHHINNFKHFKEQRTDINNGITLCFSCHIEKNGKSFHNVYGKYPSKEKFNKFIKQD